MNKSDSNLLNTGADRIRLQLASDRRFIASLETAWRSIPNVDHCPHIALQCAEEDWAWIALCQRPRADRFLEDIAKIAAQANVRSENLIDFVVKATTAEKFLGAPEEASSLGTGLLAARQREDKSEDE